MTPGASLGDGRYTLVERIATGGMGEVWRATDTVLGREVAVKILKAEFADDATFRARFQAEARNTAALHHPGIAQVFDFGEIPDTQTQRATAFLVMELVPGGPLSAVLAREGALVPDRAADIVAQAAVAIDVAHRQGIVHRDVKPANLMVTPDGAVKVTDFGIARAGDAVPLTSTGQVIGTPHYLSPEQARGNPATPASDVYSLGVVLYECLTGSRPFTADSPVAVAMQHLRDEPPALPGSVPPGVAATCMRALAKDPQDRVESAGALAARLRDPVAEPAPGDTAPLTAAGPVPQDRRRRRPGWLVPLAVAGGVLVLVGAVGVALTGGDGPQADPGPQTTPGKDAPSAESERVRVDPADYRGQPFDEARAALQADGLRVRRIDRVGEDGAPDTVAYVEPHGMVAPGATVTLGVWRPPAAPPDEDDTDDTDDPGGGNDPQPDKKVKQKDKQDQKDKKDKGHDPPGPLDLGHGDTPKPDKGED